MTVTINTLGSYSREIVITGETSATNIINAVNTSLTALGWTLFDSASSGSRGLLTTRVYSAPNNDGPSPTTKYMVIRYDLHRQYWFTSCCESWNTSTKVATNESWYGNRQILLPLQYSNCKLYVFATARYACFMGTVQDEPSAWQGVFEFERDATEDAVAKSVPNYGWTSSLTIGQPYGNITAGTSTTSSTSANNGFVACGFAPPRTASGLTGISAANNFTVFTILGSYPPQKTQVGADWTTGGITQARNSHRGMLGAWTDGQSYVWDATRTFIDNVTLGGYSSDYLVGRVYGLKITGKLGAVFDTTTVPVDANLFYSAGGTNTTHYLLGIHGSYCDTLTSGTNRLTSSVFASGTAFGNPTQTVLVSGRYIYFTTSTGFHKFDITTSTFTLNVLPAAQYYSVKFDGGNNLYVTSATANTIYRINLTDDTNTTLTMTGNWAGLAIDDDNLYVGQRGAGTTVTVKRVALSTFTEAASYTVSTGNAANSISTMTTADYSGFVYIAAYNLAAAASNLFTRIASSNGALSTLAPTLAQQLNSSTAAPCFFDGTNLYFYSFVNTTAATANGRLTIINLSTFTIVNSGSLSNSVGNVSSFNSSELLAAGSCEPISFGGMIIIPYSTTTLRVIPSDPRTTLSVIEAASSTIQAGVTLTGQYCTDQCTLYSLASTTQLYRYTTAFRNYNFLGVQSSNILIAQ